MQRVLVLDKNKKPLMPCLPVRARELLAQGKAKVYRRYPFTIILTRREGGELQEIEFKVDPGSKTTGIVLVAKFARGYVVIWGANLSHRGEQLSKRRAIRRSRRARKTRYRKPRFLNRPRKVSWLPPSLMSRVHNVYQWAKKAIDLAPVTSIAVETVRFDTQKLRNPEISGVAYQQGELLGYEIREYLLEKWGRKCAYCDKEGVPLEIEHIVPKSKRGVSSLQNLTLACKRCNKKKGNKDISEFLGADTKRLENILAKTKSTLKDAACVNATRYAIGTALKSFGLPISFHSGGQTKYNRTSQRLGKDHWIDAACVGDTGASVKIVPNFKALIIQAVGRGARQMCRVDQYGFPRTSAKSTKRIQGFQTGDIVKAVVTSGKKVGTYVGKVAVRASGFFNIQTASQTVQGISYKYCSILHRTDGYTYA